MCCRKKSVLVWLALCAFPAILFLPKETRAWQLYAAAQGDGVWIVDTATGAAAPVSAQFAQGLAFDPRTGDLYLATEGSVVCINLATGVKTEIHGINAKGLAFASCTADLFTATNFSIDIVDTKRDITRETTRVSGLDAHDLAFDPFTGVLYAAAEGGLFTVDKTSGKVTRISSSTRDFVSVAVDPLTRECYAADGHDIWKISKGANDMKLTQMSVRAVDIAFDPMTGGLFAATTDGVSAIDKMTGAERVLTENMDAIELAFFPAVLKADFDVDGAVDGDDFLLWMRGFGDFSAGGATRLDGDADGDGGVDGNDFLIWQAEFGRTTVCGSLAYTAAAHRTARLLRGPRPFGRFIYGARWLRSVIRYW